MPNWKKVITSGSDAALNSLIVSYGVTGSLLGTASWAQNALTASSVTTLNQNVIITGSLTVGSTSVGANENTLILGPAPAGGAGEGGQLLLQAQGGTYTSASMLDNWQNYTRLLRGTNASSDAVVAQFNMHTKQVAFPQYNSTTAFTGTTLVGLLGFDASGNILTTTTSSGGGGGGVTITNNTDNYILTATGVANSLNGESNLQFDGTSLTVTGQITSSGAIISQANGAMYFRGGDDAEFWDINVANTVGIYGQQNQDRAGLKLGSSGPTLFGSGSNLGIETITPNSASLHVNGNVWANSYTGSLLGTASYALAGLSSSYAVTASYANNLNQPLVLTGSLNISGSILNVDKIQFNTSSTVALTPGGINWDDGTGTLNVLLKGGNIDLQVGQENVVLVYNGEGTTLNKGEVVYVSGSQGNRPAVKRAVATSDGYSATTLGIVAENITAGAEGYVSTFGMINNLNTNGTTGGAPVWLSPSVAGGWTTTKPSAPGHTVLLGYIVRVDNTVGSIFVHISNGWELGELHDVSDSTTTGSYGDLLVKSGSLWINSKQLTGSYGATGSLSVIDANGANNLDTNVRTLYGTNGSSSVDWANRQLNATNGSPRLDWRLMYAIDPFTSRSIDWDTRTLQDTAQVTSVSWKNRVLTDTGATQALNWSLRRAYDSSGAGILSLDWRNRLLHDASTSQSLDWTNRKLYDVSGVSQSIDWAQRQLLDQNGIFSILWKDRDAFDINQSSSLNWDSRVMRDSGAPGGSGVSVSSIDWENRQAYDSAGNTSINWASRVQYDQSGNAIIDYSGASAYSILNSRPTIEDLTTAVQDEFTQVSAYNIDTNVAGNLINVDTNIDLAVTASNPVFLDTDGIWKRTDQTTDTTTKLLGICVGPYNKGVILSEGIITVTTSSGYSDITPFVSGSSFYGMPVYLTGSTATFTTDKPTSGYVRVIGHIYYNSTTNPDYWIMKFNPSNDWYEI